MVGENLQDDYLPDPASLILRAIQGANSDSYSHVVARLTPNEVIPVDEMSPEQKQNYKLLQRGKRLKDHRSSDLAELDAAYQLGGEIDYYAEVYNIEMNMEKNIIKLQLQVLFNVLSSKGFSDSRRKVDVVNEKPETFNRELSHAGGYLRFCGELSCPLPPFDNIKEMMVKYVRGYWKTDRGTISPTHSKPILDIVEIIRSYLRELIAQLVLKRLRLADIREITREFIYKASITVLTSFYAGMRRGVHSLPLRGEKYTRVYLRKLKKEAIDRAELIRDIRSSNLTTVTRELNERFDIPRSRDLQQFKDQIGELVNHFSDMHLRKEMYWLALRRRRWGNRYHRLLGKLLGIPYNVSIDDIFAHPERFTIFNNNWLIAAEVSYYYENTYGIIDLLILKLVEYRDRAIMVPVLLLDRKTKLYEIFNLTGEVYQRRNTPKLDTEDRVHIRVVHRKQEMQMSVFELVLHSIGTSSDTRYVTQINTYAYRIGKRIQEYNRRFIPDMPLVEPVRGFLVNDVGVGIDELAAWERQLFATLFDEMESGEFYRHIHRDTVVVPQLIDERDEKIYLGTGLVVLKHEGSEFFDYPAIDYLDGYELSPFQYSNRADRYRGNIHLHFPVAGVHQSNRHVSFLSSLRYLMRQLSENLDEGGTILLLDVSDYLAEFPKQKLLGYKGEFDDGLDQYRDDQYQGLEKVYYKNLEIKTIYYPEIDASVSDDAGTDRSVIRKRAIFELFDKNEYQYIIITGLNLLVDFRKDEVSIYREELVEVVGLFSSDIYLIEKPVEDVGLSGLHRIKSVLPYELPKSDQIIPNYLELLKSITYNIPRVPVSSNTDHPIRDEHRLILQINDKMKITTELISDYRFTYTSIFYTNPTKYWYIRKKSRDRNKSEELVAAASLLQWLDPQRFRAFYVELPTTPMIFEYSRYRGEDKPILLRYKLDSDIVSRIKHAVPLNRINSKRKFHIKSRIYRNRHRFSTKTPRIEDFELLRGTISIPDDDLINREVSYLTQLVEICRNPDFIPQLKRSLGTDKLIRQFRETNLRLATTVKNILNNMEDNILQLLRMVLSVTKTRSEKDTINYFYRNLQLIDEKLDLRDWFDKYPVGHWLILLLRNIWNIYPSLTTIEISQIYYTLRPWLFVQFDLPLNQDHADITWVPEEAYILQIPRILSTALRMAKNLQNRVMEQLRNFLYSNISNFQPVQACYYPQGQLIIFTLPGSHQQFLLKSYVPLATNNSYRKITKVNISNSYLQAPHNQDKMVIITSVGKEYLFVANPVSKQWECLGRIRILQYHIRLDEIKLPAIPFSLYHDQSIHDNIDHKIGRESDIYLAYPKLSISEKNYHFTLTNQHGDRIFEHKISYTDELIEIIREPIGDNEFYITYDDEKYTWNPYDVKVGSDVDQELQRELYKLLEFVVNTARGGYPFDADDLINIVLSNEQAIEQPIPLGHNPACPITGLKQVEIDQPGSVTEHHEYCIYLEIENKEIRDIFNVMLEDQAEEHDRSNPIVLSTGKNYLRPWQLNVIVGIPYIITPDYVKHEFHYYFEKNDDDPFEFMVLKEGKNLYWVFKKLFSQYFGAKRTQAGSYLATKRYELQQITIKSKRVVYIWQLRDQSNYYVTYILADDACEMVDNLIEGRNFLGHYPLGNITEEIIIDWKETQELISSEIEDWIITHANHCKDHGIELEDDE